MNGLKGSAGYRMMLYNVVKLIPRTQSNVTSNQMMMMKQWQLKPEAETDAETGVRARTRAV